MDASKAQGVIVNFETNSQSSKSGSIGVGIQLGAGGAQMGVTVSASAGKGQGAGDGTTFTNAQVSGQSVQITSGGDTTLKGAVVKADQVAANVGGNLTIESLQDQSQYREKSQQVGGSVTFGPAPGGSLSAGQTKINSDYQSVNEQTAIRAGDGGFQVSVAGKTELVGGQITSTQAAIDNNKNSYQDQGGPSSCESMVAGMDAQIKLLSDDKIVSMCAGDTQCVTDRKDERSLYVQVRNEAASKLEPEAAARAYLNSQSSAPYDKQQLAAALTRVQNGTAQANNPVDQYVRNSLAADPPMLAAVLSVSAFDTDGGRSAPRSGVGDALAERGSPVPDEVAALRRIASNQNGPDLANKAPNSVLNQKAIKDLADGKLPGVTYNSKTGLPDVVPRTGVPREMPASPNPNATAEDFAFRMLGRQPTPQEVARGELMFGGNCPGCWVGKTQDGVVITFRPAGKATKTLNDTASVDINFITNDINNGRPLKLKFPGDK